MEEHCSQCGGAIPRLHLDLDWPRCEGCSPKEMEGMSEFLARMDPTPVLSLYLGNLLTVKLDDLNRGIGGRLYHAQCACSECELWNFWPGNRDPRYCKKNMVKNWGPFEEDTVVLPRVEEVAVRLVARDDGGPKKRRRGDPPTRTTYEWKLPLPSGNLTAGDLQSLAKSLREGDDRTDLVPMDLPPGNGTSVRCEVTGKTLHMSIGCEVAHLGNV